MHMPNHTVTKTPLVDDCQQKRHASFPTHAFSVSVNVMFNHTMLNRIRAAELESALPFLPKGARILEIGSGTGEQARLLTDLGYEVIAVDIKGTDYTDYRLFPVIDYEGDTLPVESHSIDVVYSSNVLEHVPTLDILHKEFIRVLKPNGFCVHILPTTSWRLWTLLLGPFDLPARMFHILKTTKPAGLPRAFAREIYITCVPHLHGERGNAITELGYFSKCWWTHTFRKNGFVVEKTRPAGYAYTGWLIFGDKLSLSARNILSHIVGSSCRIYVVRRGK